MAWKNFSQEATGLTVKEIESFSKDIMRNFDKAKKEINSLIKEQYDKFLSAVGTDDYYNEMIKYDRLTKLQHQVNISYLKYTKENAKLTEQSSRVAFSNNYYRKVYSSQWLSTQYNMLPLPDDLIELTVLGTQNSWKNIKASTIKNFGDPKLYQSKVGTLSNLINRNRRKELEAIQDSITQGFLNGSSYSEMSKEVSKTIGTKITKNGITKYTGAKASSMKIVRTESNRILNDAAFANMHQLLEQDIAVKKLWNAALGLRTRPSHGRLDGQIKDIDAYFYIGQDKALKPGGFGLAKNNINCRCNISEIINDKPPTLRRGRNPVTGKNEVFDYKKFDTWVADNGLKTNKFGEIYK